MVTRYGIPFIAATLKADPGYNFITQKASVGADSASLKTQQALRRLDAARVQHGQCQPGSSSSATCKAQV
jgi:hypothetical protein